MIHCFGSGIPRRFLIAKNRDNERRMLWLRKKGQQLRGSRAGMQTKVDVEAVLASIMMLKSWEKERVKL